MLLKPIKQIAQLLRDLAAALIVKGWRIEEEEMLPWQATLFSHEDGEWKFFCGGTLIAERVVLTAGHCLWKTSTDTVRVAFGILSSNLTEAEENAQVIDVESIRLQSAYQDHESNYGSDIALLILKTAVIIDSIVSPVCLPQRFDSTLREAQENGGFGLVAGEHSHWLQKNLVSERQCNCYITHVKKFTKNIFFMVRLMRIFF